MTKWERIIHRARCSKLDADDAAQASREALGANRMMIHDQDFHLEHARLINDSVLGFLYTKRGPSEEWDGGIL